MSTRLRYLTDEQLEAKRAELRHIESLIQTQGNAGLTGTAEYQGLKASKKKLEEEDEARLSGPPGYKEVVHRDIKPANIFLREPTRPYESYPKPVLGDLDGLLRLNSKNSIEEKGWLRSKTYTAPENMFWRKRTFEKEHCPAKQTSGLLVPYCGICSAAIVEKSWTWLNRIFGDFSGEIPVHLRLRFKKDSFPLLRPWNVKKRRRDDPDDDEDTDGNDQDHIPKNKRHSGDVIDDLEDAEIDFNSDADEDKPKRKRACIAPGVQSVIRARGRTSTFRDVTEQPGSPPEYQSTEEDWSDSSRDVGTQPVQVLDESEEGSDETKDEDSDAEDGDSDEDSNEDDDSE
ncbi:hypothetical protein EK21DRAFT_114501 [Setomelanomma holmii]|uniref:Protein kinase domain-containing protein n=1 Tax=Setomelanomma holmii TaxID=210430 RepID=A0A9P4H6T8_9PLEO|nr:hypothetical protein EK21DRAFT_114501 [Setomelanomma holmii]